MTEAWEPPSEPETLSVAVEAKQPGRGVYAMRRFLSGIVETHGGMVRVDLATGANKDEPTQFVLSFRTRDTPAGRSYHIDVTDMLESLVTAYFAAHPDDAPSDDLDSLFPDG